MPESTTHDLGELVERIERGMRASDESTLTIAFDGKDGDFVVALHAGREADDSDMVGAASYGVDSELSAALKQVADEFRFR